MSKRCFILAERQSTAASTERAVVDEGVEVIVVRKLSKPTSWWSDCCDLLSIFNWL